MAQRTILSFLLVSLVSGAIAPAPAAPEARIDISAESPRQQAMAEWALGRFEDAGLGLPPLSIVFSDRDQAPCGGEPAMTYFEETPRVMVCWADGFVLLHELAHVWVEGHVEPADRERFMAMRDGVTVWAGNDTPWVSRGSEHAANVVAWGLLETPRAISRTYPNDKVSLAAAFVVLTGTGPLHDGGPDFVAPDPAQYADRPTVPLDSGR